MEKLVARVDMMTHPLHSPSSHATHTRPSALKKKEATPVSVDAALKYPNLDPGVVLAAVSAGVEEDALAQMQRLMQDGQKKQKKLADPGSSPCPPGLTVNATARTGLSEWTQEVDGGEPAAASGLGQHTEESPIVHAVTKLAEIMSVLAADKMKRGKGSVEAALDGISSPGVAESGSLGSGKRAAAARRALRTALQENPSEIHQLLERAMLEDLTSQTLVPGQPAPVLCSRAWIEHRSRIGHWKTAAYTAWTAGGALDCLIKGDVAGGRARLCLLLLMLDQTACDRGSWTLSSELSLESSPPMAVLGQHQPPAVAEGEQPFSRLLDPRWAEVATFGTPRISCRGG